MDKKGIQQAVDRQQNQKLQTDYEYNLTVNEVNKNEPTALMTIGFLPPALKINSDSAPIAGCSRTTPGTLAGVKSAPIPLSRFQAVTKVISPSYRFVKKPPIPKENSPKRAVTGTAQILNIPTTTVFSEMSLPNQHHQYSVQPNQEGYSSLNRFETQKSILKYIKPKGPDPNQTGSRNRSEDGSQNQLPEAVSHSEKISKSSGRSQKRKSIKILRKNLTALDGDATKKVTSAASSSSVENFLEQDIVKKGVEILDSLDDQSLRVLVKKVMDLINKMYGDYLAEELEKHLGPEKYGEIAREGITAYDEFLAKKHMEINKENLCPAGRTQASTGGIQFSVDTSTNANATSVRSPIKQAQKQPGFVKVDPKTLHSSSNLCVQLGKVEKDQKNSEERIAMKGNSLCQSSTTCQIDARTSLGGSEFLPIPGFNKGTPGSLTTTKPEECVHIDTSKVNGFNLRDNLNNIVEEVIAQEEKAAADLFITEKIARLKKIDSSVTDNLEENFTFDETKRNNGPPEKIFDSPEDPESLLTPTASFRARCQPRKLLQVDGGDEKNRKPKEMPVLKKNSTVLGVAIEECPKVSSVDRDKKSESTFKGTKHPPKNDDKFKFDPLLSNPSEHVTTNESVLSSPETTSFLSTKSTLSSGSSESLKMLEESLFQTPKDVKSEEMPKEQSSDVVLTLCMPNKMEGKGSILIKRFSNVPERQCGYMSNKPIPEIVHNIRSKFFEKVSPKQNEVNASKKAVEMNGKSPSSTVKAKNGDEPIRDNQNCENSKNNSASEQLNKDLKECSVNEKTLATKGEEDLLTKKLDQKSTEEPEEIFPIKEKQQALGNEKPLPNLKEMETVNLLESKNSQAEEEKPLEKVEQCPNTVIDSNLNNLRNNADEDHSASMSKDLPKTPETDKSSSQELFSPTTKDSSQKSLQPPIVANESPDLETSMNDLAQLLLSLQGPAPSSAEKTSESSNISNESFETFAQNTVKSLIIESDDCILVEEDKSTSSKAGQDEDVADNVQEVALLGGVKEQEPSASKTITIEEVVDEDGGNRDPDKSVRDIAQLLMDFQKSGPSKANLNLESGATVCDDDCVLVEEICSPQTCRNRKSKIITVDSDDCMLVEVETVPRKEELHRNNTSDYKCSKELSCTLVKEVLKASDVNRASVASDPSRRLLTKYLEHKCVRQSPSGVADEHSYPKPFQSLSISYYTGQSPSGSHPRRVQSTTRSPTASVSMSRVTNKKSSLPSGLDASKATASIPAKTTKTYRQFVSTKSEKHHENIPDDDCILVETSESIVETPLTCKSVTRDDVARYRRAQKARAHRQRNFLRNKVRTLSKIILTRIRVVRRTYNLLKMLVNVINLNRDDVNVDNFTLTRKIRNLKTIYQQVNDTFIAFKSRDVRQLKMACRRMRMIYGGKGGRIGNRRKNVVKKEAVKKCPAKVEEERADGGEEKNILFDSPHDDRKLPLKPLKTYSSKARRNIFRTYKSEAEIEETFKSVKKEDYSPCASTLFFDEIRKSSLHRDENSEENVFRSMPTPESIVHCIIYKDTPIPLIGDAKEELIIPDPLPTVKLPSPEMVVVKPEPLESPVIGRFDPLRRGQKRKARSSGTPSNGKESLAAPTPWNLRRHATEEPPEHSAKKKKADKTPDVQRSYSLRSRHTGSST